MSEVDSELSRDVAVLASVRRRLLRGSSWVFVGRIASIVLGVGINALLARLLTHAEFGGYFTCFTLVNIGTVVAQLGLDRAVVRLVSASLGLGQPGRARDAIHKVLVTGISASVLVGALMLALGPWLSASVYHSSVLRAAIPMTAAWLVTSAIQSLFVETFRGLQRFGAATLLDAVIVDVIWAASFAALLVLGVHVGLPAVVGISAAAVGVITAIGAFLLHHEAGRIEGSGTVSTGEITDIAWPSLITNIAIYFLGTGVDLLVLGAFRPQQDVAVYGAATRLVVLVATPLWILRGVMPPLIAELHAQGRRQELEDALRAGATLAGLPSLLILAAFIVFAKPIMGGLYTHYYERGAILLIVLSIGRFVSVWAGSSGVTLIFTGHQKSMMNVTLLTGVLSVAGGILLAPHFGGLGVAAATTVMAIAQNVAQVIMAKRLAGVWSHVELSPRALHRFFSKKGLAALAHTAGRAPEEPPT